MESIAESDKITVREELKTKNKGATRPSHTSAPEITATVASFRTWRSSQLIVAREPKQVTISRALYIFQPNNPLLFRLFQGFFHYVKAATAMSCIMRHYLKNHGLTVPH